MFESEEDLAELHEASSNAVAAKLAIKWRLLNFMVRIFTVCSIMVIQIYQYPQLILYE